jgi:hypothetical protein
MEFLLQRRAQTPRRPAVRLGPPDFNYWVVASQGETAFKSKCGVLIAESHFGVNTSISFVTPHDRNTTLEAFSVTSDQLSAFEVICGQNGGRAKTCRAKTCRTKFQSS